MKIINNLKGSVTDGIVEERRGFTNSLHLEPKSGFFLKMQLGEAGLFLRRGDDVVVIPCAELLNLALPHLNGLKKSTPQKPQP